MFYYTTSDYNDYLKIEAETRKAGSSDDYS